VKDLWKTCKPILEVAETSTPLAIPQDQILQLADTNLTLLAEMNKLVSIYEKEATLKA
jgi:hypothetical protein